MQNVRACPSPVIDESIRFILPNQHKIKPPPNHHPDDLYSGLGTVASSVIVDTGVQLFTVII